MLEEYLVPILTGYQLSDIQPQYRIETVVVCLDTFWSWITEWTIQEYSTEEAIRVRSLRKYGESISHKFQEVDEILLLAIKAFFKQYT